MACQASHSPNCAARIAIGKLLFEIASYRWRRSKCGEVRLYGDPCHGDVGDSYEQSEEDLRDGFLAQILLEVGGAVSARIEIRERFNEVLHGRPLGAAWFVRVPCSLRDVTNKFMRIHTYQKYLQ